ncbi:MAG: efflux RND transporter periplasmic adaptor subunit [Vicinamibacterales bacterium]|nr:efflux RND transporter periplasmic adaptor subunit [Vicinamibacterales bacterium]
MALGQQDVAVARLAEIGGAITISGPLEPYQVVNIRAQASGTVTGLRVDRGTSVRAGQVLAVIEAAGIRSQAAGARAGVAAARANLAVARQRLEAANTLKQAGAMSDIDYRVAVATYEASAAQLAAAQAQAATAGEAAANTAVVSPISGVISARTIQPGEAVAPGAPLLTVVNPSILELAGQAGVNQASRIQVGQPVIFEVDAFPGREFEGRVSRKDPTADPGTRQVGIYVRLPNADGRIVGGQFARGRIVTRSAQQVVVPQVAIRTVGNAPTVLVISNNRIQRRPVTLGDRDEATGTIGVLSGVQAGDVIVVASSDLPAGTRVTVAADAAAAVPRPGVPASSREP